MTQHHREQPHDPRRRWLVGEHHLELRKINLALLARRGLKANFKALFSLWPDIPQEDLHHRVAALIAETLQIPEQPLPG